MSYDDRPNDIEEILECNIELDVRPFTWPRRPKRRPGIRPRQLKLFRENAYMEYTREDFKALLKTMGQRNISYMPILADITGTAGAGIFLSQCFYWHDKGTATGDGFFYKTLSEWREETKLAVRELDWARKRSLELGFTTEKKYGVPPRIHYKLNLDRVIDAILNFQNSHSVEIENTDDSNFTLCENQTLHSVENINTENTSLESSLLTRTPVTGPRNNVTPIREEEDFFFDCLGQSNVQMQEYEFDFPENNSPLTEETELNPHVTRNVLEPEIKSVAFGPQAEQLTLFKTKKAQPKKFNLPSEPIPDAFRSMMYRLCFAVNSTRASSILTRDKIGQASNAMRNLIQAGADLQHIPLFKNWWDTTWMSREKSGAYQYPRPDQVQENWFKAMDWVREKANEAQKEDEKKKEQQENKQVDVLTLMRNRANDRRPTNG